MKVRYFACALALAPSFATAQLASQPVATPPIALANTGNAMLRIGTEIPLKLSEELTTKGKKLKLGQRFHMETAEAVFVQGVEVIPVGSVAVGEITDVRNKGMWGKSGHFGARVLYLTVHGRQVRLTGNFDNKGTAGGIGATAVSAVVFLPAGFFMTGTSARLPVGTPIKAFTDEDVPLAFASATPAPLAVAVPVTTGIVPVAAPSSLLGDSVVKPAGN